MKKIIAVVFTVSLLILPSVMAEDNPKFGGTIIWGRGPDSVSLDPSRPTDNESSKVNIHIYENLVQYRDDSTEVIPALATSWETSDSGKEWIFHLRKNVQFHDGTPFNADAVVFSFARQLDPSHPFYRKNLPGAAYTFRNVKKIRAIDPYTVSFLLEKPYAPFLYNLAIPYAAPIVSPTAVKKWGDDFENHPVGTGAFQFLRWQKGDRIVLVKNQNYWNKPAYIDKVVFRSIPDNKNRLLALNSLAIDGMDGINPDSIKYIKTRKDLGLIVKPGLNIGYIAMNMEKCPFHIREVRQAVNYAINKENLIKLVYKNLAVPAKNPIPPILWGYNDDIQDYPFNPEKARALLKKAGYENGFKTTLWAMNIPRPYMPQPKKLAKAVKSNLAAVGIRVRIVTKDWKPYVAGVKNGEHDMALLGWVGDNGDPDNFLYAQLDKENAVKPKAMNRAFFKNEEVHRLLIKAQQISDTKERIQLYRRVQEIFHLEAPWVPLAHVQQVVAHNKKIKGLIFHSTEMIKFHKTWIDPK